MDGKRIQRSVLSRAVRGRDSVVSVNASGFVFILVFTYFIIISRHIQNTGRS